MTHLDRATEQAATRHETEAVAAAIGQYFGRPDADVQPEFVWLDDEPDLPGWWRLTWADGPDEWAHVIFEAAMEGSVQVSPSLYFDIEGRDNRILTIGPASAT